MWRKIRKVLLGEGRLIEDKDGNAPSRELQLAAAALLLEAAAGDTDISKEEELEIARDLSFEFGISKSKSFELMQDAEEIRMTHASLAPVVKFIADSFSLEQRIEVLSLVWRVVAVDDLIEDFERVFSESLVPLLKINHEQAVLARQRAKEYIKENS